jgi:Ca-activated chloride channel family protein
MSFASPLWLLALALVPAALFAYDRARRGRKRYAVRYTAVANVQLAVGETRNWQRHLPAALALAAIAALAFALARPHIAYSAAADQASVMLVIDHSGSMAATDVHPTRLSAAQSAANTFIGELPSSALVGAVGFGTSADGVQAPSSNHAAAAAVVNNEVANGSTATGDALALALQLLHGSNRHHPPSAVVLLSDGAANAGQSPVSVAQEARQDKIPIDTVALGTPNGTLQNPDPFAGPIPVPPDPQLMAQIAKASGGRTFDAQDAGTLSSIYRRLGKQLGSVTRKHEVTAEFAAAGLVLLALAVGAGVRFGARLP